ncbi:MAG: hypothetical protein ACRDLV_15095 [Solirubrobacteraceae bacterium]
MTEHQSTRTLVKSAPELWAECSDAASLARHLGAFGEIRITRLEPESTVAWEGAAASGTVRLEPSGWGTRVTMTMVQEGGAALPAAAEPPPEVELAEAQPHAPEPRSEADEPRPAGMLARFRLRWRRTPQEPTVVSHQPPESEATTVVAAPEATAATVETTAAVAETEAEPEVEAPGVGALTEPPPVLAGDDALAAALDSLGRAHHRPYSRA